jgi:hypothetical protein
MQAGDRAASVEQLASIVLHAEHSNDEDNGSTPAQQEQLGQLFYELGMNVDEFGGARVNKRLGAIAK